uniref:Uncharacterized protein n=1 Tax=Medicago truncatula TaxID=3880 RepID=I3SKI4_MEDTR|nr:unknown [Medicago truncatula]
MRMNASFLPVTLYLKHILYVINKLKVDMLQRPLDMRIIPFLFEVGPCRSILS